MAATNKALLRYDGTYGVNSKGERVLMPTAESWAAQEQDRLQRQAAAMRGHNRLVNIGRFASVAIPTAGIGLAASGAGAAASAAPSVAASTAGTAGTAGAGMTFGNLLKLGELGAGLFTNVIGNRQQNRALDRDSLLRQQEFSQQMALAQQQQAQAQKQWEAEQAQRANEYALAIEDRNRRIKLEDEREARRAPYRAMAQQALMRFGDLLRLGRG